MAATMIGGGMTATEIVAIATDSRGESAIRPRTIRRTGRSSRMSDAAIEAITTIGMDGMGMGETIAGETIGGMG